MARGLRWRTRYGAAGVSSGVPRRLSTDREEYFKAYGEYSKVLRTWFVAYGIGAPVLFLTNDALAEALRTSREGRFVAGFFLAGVLLQVVLAILNKFSMWGIYYGEFKDPFKGTRWYRIAHWFSERFSIDAVLDVLTFLAFAIATWRGYQILVT